MTTTWREEVRCVDPHLEKTRAWKVGDRIALLMSPSTNDKTIPTEIWYGKVVGVQENTIVVVFGWASKQVWIDCCSDSMFKANTSSKTGVVNIRAAFMNLCGEGGGRGCSCCICAPCAPCVPCVPCGSCRNLQ